MQKDGERLLVLYNSRVSMALLAENHIKNNHPGLILSLPGWYFILR
jgi:hypothetical protein